MAQNHAIRLARDLTFAVLGPRGRSTATPAGRGGRSRWRPASTASASWSRARSFAQGPPIYGGSDQIQRNIVGERVLGLPREPRADRGVPFRDLPKN